MHRMERYYRQSICSFVCPLVGSPARLLRDAVIVIEHVYRHADSAVSDARVVVVVEVSELNSVRDSLTVAAGLQLLRREEASGERFSPHQRLWRSETAVREQRTYSKWHVARALVSRSHIGPHPRTRSIVQRNPDQQAAVGWYVRSFVVPTPHVVAIASYYPACPPVWLRGRESFDACRIVWPGPSRPNLQQRSCE